MPLYELLEWDTKVLNIKVAKIIPERMSQELLGKVLTELKKINIQLVYWCSEREDDVSQKAANFYHGFLADEKVTYAMSLASMRPLLEKENWKRYEKKEASAALIKLALDVGKVSRFSKDPRIGFAGMKGVYTQWINNSCLRKIADEVLMIEEKEKIKGMVTVGKKNQRGDIGLLAVSPDFYGQGYGKELVCMAQNYFFKKNMFDVQVVTQKDNKAACALYEKSGFMLESIQNFYHFWL